MKITKIAGGIPAGFVEIEYDIGEQDQEVTVVGHGPGTGCKLEYDDQILQDIMEAEVGEFGGGSNIDGTFKTQEWYNEEQKGKPTPKGRFNLNPPKQRDFSTPDTQEEDRVRQINQGY